MYNYILPHYKKLNYKRLINGDFYKKLKQISRRKCMIYPNSRCLPKPNNTNSQPTLPTTALLQKAMSALKQARFSSNLFQNSFIAKA